MTRKKIDFAFKPGHVYLMNEYDDTGESEIFDLSEMDEKTTRKLLAESNDTGEF